MTAKTLIGKILGQIKMKRILILKAGPLSNRPGLALQTSVDRMGHQVHRWKRTGADQHQERIPKGTRNPNPTAKPKGDEYDKPHVMEMQKQGRALFSGAEHRLPEDAFQPVKDPAQLFAQGAESLKMMSEWLNEGSGLADQLGYATYKDYNEAMDFLRSKASGGMLMMAPLKSMKRSMEKVKADYKGDWSKLTDVVRAAFAVDTLEELPRVLNALRKSGMKLAKAPKDRFMKPLPVGYRDVLLNITFPNGHIGELQVHVKPMLAAKELQAHKHYEVMRTIEAAMKDDDERKIMTPDEKAAYDMAFDASVAIYGQAWSEINTALHKSIIGHEMTEGIQYYNKDGALLRRQSSNHWPEIYEPDSGGWRPYRNMFAFDHDADPITEDAAKRLIHGYDH